MVNKKDYRLSVSMNKGTLIHLARLKIRNKDSVEIIKIRATSKEQLDKYVEHHMNKTNGTEVLSKPKKEEPKKTRKKKRGVF